MPITDIGNCQPPRCRGWVHLIRVREIAFHHMKYATNGLFPHQVAFYGARGHVLDERQRRPVCTRVANARLRDSLPLRPGRICERRCRHPIVASFPHSQRLPLANVAVPGATSPQNRLIGASPTGVTKLLAVTYLLDDFLRAISSREVDGFSSRNIGKLLYFSTDRIERIQSTLDRATWLDLKRRDCPSQRSTSPARATQGNPARQRRHSARLRRYRVDFSLARSVISLASKRNSSRRPVPLRQTRPIFRV